MLGFSKLPEGYKHPVSIKLTAAEHSDARHNLLFTIYTPFTFCTRLGTSNANQLLPLLPPAFFRASTSCPSQHPHATRLALLSKQEEKLGFREFFGSWSSLWLKLKSCRNSSADGRVKWVLRILTEFLSGKKQIQIGFPSVQHVHKHQPQCWWWQQRTSREL